VVAERPGGRRTRPRSDLIAVGASKHRGTGAARGVLRFALDCSGALFKMRQVGRAASDVVGYA